MASYFKATRTACSGAFWTAMSIVASWWTDVLYGKYAEKYTASSKTCKLSSGHSILYVPIEVEMMDQVGRTAPQTFCTLVNGGGQSEFSIPCARALEASNRFWGCYRRQQLQNLGGWRTRFGLHLRTKSSSNLIRSVGQRPCNMHWTHIRRIALCI